MNHWQSPLSWWPRLGPPLRPTPEVVSCIRRLAQLSPGPVLLLGVTPELAQAFDAVHAVDKNQAMIDAVWPGDNAARKAVLGDWLDIPGPDDRFAAVVGDGSLTTLSYPRELKRMLQRVFELLAPGGHFVCRLFERPAPPFTQGDLEEAGAGRVNVNFHAFKWMLAMHLAEEGGASLPVERILSRFDHLFPDRGLLSARTGWSRQEIETIESYRGSSATYGFPSRAELLSLLPAGFTEAQFHSCGSYALAPCCPILSCRKP
jgi:SAM-dependent methyltransferase